MCSFPYIFLVNVLFWSYFSQYILATAQASIVICLQSLTLKALYVWFYSGMRLHKDFTFLLLFFFYSTAHVESE